MKKNDKRKKQKRDWLRRWRQNNQELAKQKSREATKKAMEWKQKFIYSVKDQPCADCGKVYPPWIMTFDHCRGKNFPMIDYSRSIDSLINEMALCEIVCFNCHADRTHRRKNVN